MVDILMPWCYKCNTRAHVTAIGLTADRDYPCEGYVRLGP